MYGQKVFTYPLRNLRFFFFFPSIFSWIDIIVYRKIRQIFHLIPFLHEKPVKSGHQGTIYSGKKEEESEMC